MVKNSGFIAGLAVAALALAGCTVGSQTAGNPPADSDSAQSARENGPITFTHPHPRLDGMTIEFEAQPEPDNIVVDCFSLRSMLEYGIEPVAIFGSDCDNPNVMGDIDISEYETIGRETEIDLERLAELRPDAIVGNSPDGTGPTRFDEDVKEQMTRIAPFVALPVGTSVDGDIAAAREVAEFLGGDVDSEAIAQADADLAAAKESFANAVEGKDLRVMLAWPSAETVRTGVGFKQANLLEELGVDIIGPEGPAEGSPWGQVAWEELGTYEADVILNEDFGRDDVFTSELWEAQPAIEEGQVAGWSSRGNHSAQYYADWLNDLAERASDWEELS